MVSPAESSSGLEVVSLNAASIGPSGLGCPSCD